MSRNYPLLFKLVLTQLGILLLGFFILVFVYLFTFQAQIDSTISTLKEQVTPVLAEKEEEWRAWNYLGLNEALLSEKNKLIKQYPIESIEIIQRKDLPNQLRHTAIVLPKKNKNPEDYVLYAEISSKTLKNAIEAQRTLFYVFGCVASLFLGSVIFSALFIFKNIYRPIMALNQFFLNRKEDVSLEFNKLNVIGEMKQFVDALEEMLKRNQKFEKQEAYLELAGQVAHDIRSPLEALKSFKIEINEIPENKRIQLELSINRIEEIAFNLLKNYKQNKNKEDVRSEELHSLVKSILIEKEIEYRFRNVLLIEKFNENSYGLYSRIQRNSLKNIISNLINNGVESVTEGTSIITISLYESDGFNLIEVSDNGRGILEENKASLFNKGFTTKESGNGFGLYHAKKIIEAAGGKINFHSNSNSGTTFYITLPKSSPPLHHLDAIHLYKYDKIIILDDDLTFHEVWKNKLLEINDRVEHIYSAQEMLSKYKTLPFNTLLLTDYGLMDDSFDGIDIVLKLNHMHDSILVTARYEEQEIIEKCSRYNIPIISKTSLSVIKVIYKDPHLIQNCNIVLIDDDKFTRLNWEMYCKRKSISITCFKSIDEFLFHYKNFDSIVHIFLDSNLGENIRGEVESEKLAKLGFVNLYLATGYDQEMVLRPDWILKVCSKSPENIIEILK